MKQLKLYALYTMTICVFLASSTSVFAGVIDYSEIFTAPYINAATNAEVSFTSYGETSGDLLSRYTANATTISANLWLEKANEHPMWTASAFSGLATAIGSYDTPFAVRYVMTSILGDYANIVLNFAPDFSYFDLSSFGPDGVTPGQINIPTLGFSDQEIITNMRFERAATPIPGAVWLLGSGLIGLVGLRRRSRN